MSFKIRVEIFVITSITARIMVKGNIIYVQTGYFNINM